MLLQMIAKCLACLLHHRCLKTLLIRYNNVCMLSFTVRPCLYASLNWKGFCITQPNQMRQLLAELICAILLIKQLSYTSSPASIENDASAMHVFMSICACIFISPQKYHCDVLLSDSSINSQNTFTVRNKSNCKTQSNYCALHEVLTEKFNYSRNSSL